MFIKTERGRNSNMKIKLKREIFMQKVIKLNPVISRSLLFLKTDKKSLYLYN